LNLHRFEDLTRSLSGVPSRRNLLGGLVAGVLGLGATPFSDLAAAKKKRKRKKKEKKAKPNAFGCLEVGDPCQSEEQCCSGICDGKKGKNQCRAHDTGTCNQEGPILVPCNNQSNCGCFGTTASSFVCAELFPPSECAACQRDADCLALGFPPGSACAPFGECKVGTACMVPC
jgi:hypothetical protein